MALYLGKDKIAGHSIDSKIGDTLPVGAIIDYDGTEVPANWELVEGAENSAAAGTVVFSTNDTDEVAYDKIVSCVEMAASGQPSFKNAVMYEDTLYYADWNAMPIYSYLTLAEGSLTDLWLSFHSEDKDYVFDYVIRAYIDNGVKKISRESVEREMRGISMHEIHFNVGNTTFKALRGMSWNEWIDSSYNTQSYIKATEDTTALILTNQYFQVYLEPYNSSDNNISICGQDLIIGNGQYLIGTSPIPV